jgi:hypothetical protein
MGKGKRKGEKRETHVQTTFPVSTKSMNNVAKDSAFGIKVTMTTNFANSLLVNARSR